MRVRGKRKLLFDNVSVFSPDVALKEAEDLSLSRVPSATAVVLVAADVPVRADGVPIEKEHHDQAEDRVGVHIPVHVEGEKELAIPVEARVRL